MEKRLFGAYPGPFPLGSFPSVLLSYTVPSEKRVLGFRYGHSRF